MRTCTRLWRSVRYARAKSQGGPREFQARKPKSRQAETSEEFTHYQITGYPCRKARIRRCGCARSGALQCPSTSLALLSPPEVHPRIRLASVETALKWPAIRRCRVKSALSALVTWE